jgi:hypothetical protein
VEPVLLLLLLPKGVLLLIPPLLPAPQPEQHTPTSSE